MECPVTEITTRGEYYTYLVTSLNWMTRPEKEIRHRRLLSHVAKQNTFWGKHPRWVSIDNTQIFVFGATHGVTPPLTSLSTVKAQLKRHEGRSICNSGISCDGGLMLGSDGLRMCAVFGGNGAKVNEYSLVFWAVAIIYTPHAH